MRAFDCGHACRGGGPSLPLFLPVSHSSLGLAVGRPACISPLPPESFSLPLFSLLLAISSSPSRDLACMVPLSRLSRASPSTPRPPPASSTRAHTSPAAGLLLSTCHSPGCSTHHRGPAVCHHRTRQVCRTSRSSRFYCPWGFSCHEGAGPPRALHQSPSHTCAHAHSAGDRRLEPGTFALVDMPGMALEWVLFYRASSQPCYAPHPPYPLGLAASRKSQPLMSRSPADSSNWLHSSTARAWQRRRLSLFSFDR